MHPLLHVEEELRIGRLRPEVLHDGHRLEELRSEWSALGEAGRVDDGLKRRVAADLPPFMLDRRLREPFDVAQSVFLVVGCGHHRNALAAKLREMTLRAGGIDEETDLVAADVRILVEAREE